METIIDWTQSMAHSYEYYLVDPNTWEDKIKLNFITGSTISRDLNSDLIYTASISSTEELGECYIRIYLIINQNGIIRKEVLATVLVQTPSSNRSIEINNYNMKGYSPVTELTENQPPLGYAFPKNSNVMEMLNDSLSNIRPPFRVPLFSKKLYKAYVFDYNANWLSNIKSLLKYSEHRLEVTPFGELTCVPYGRIESERPEWVYTDDNTSILYPEIKEDYDIYGIPNVVEIIYSSGKESPIRSVVKNEDNNSILSIKARGREILYRDTNPTLYGEPTQKLLDDYAKSTLEKLSTVEKTISYKHGYCPVNVGDCIEFNCPRYNLNHVKARVISQQIDCVTGCPVQETASYITKLWRKVQ